ncbi:uncharacterized protein LOC130113368 isoform X2 [Lampris incognitus]|uniref:uncharacterized protein LOC130113368 isoform X2 n=1 Tax=Lampris incognitus TaxID=2546036 RepID=UPI0024B4DC0E|nr:uncharacterized protein LOC130113368 isoform X2 [Lampris incognitus]
MVMLGLRTTPKENLQSSSTEVVYGQPLQVPGDFVPNTTSPWSAAHQWTTLLDNARAFAPVPTSQHGLPQSHIPASLQLAEYVSIHHHAHRGPLQPPYDRPFHVLETGNKHFVVEVDNKPEHISADRLKPAHLDLDRSVGVAQPPRRGRPPTLPPPPNKAPKVAPPPALPPCCHRVLKAPLVGTPASAPVR